MNHQSYRGTTMLSYCEDCDEFFDYKLLENKKACPSCGKDLKYFQTKAMASRYARVKARCMHCKLFHERNCPEDITKIEPLYKKACESFIPKKDAVYRR